MYSGKNTSKMEEEISDVQIAARKLEVGLGKFS